MLWSYGTFCTRRCTLASAGTSAASATSASRSRARWSGTCTCTAGTKRRTRARRAAGATRRRATCASTCCRTAAPGRASAPSATSSTRAPDTSPATSASTSARPPPRRCRQLPATTTAGRSHPGRRRRSREHTPSLARPPYPSAFRRPSPTCRTAFPAQHLRPSGVLSCWPDGLELSPGFYPGSNEQHRLF